MDAATKISRRHWLKGVCVVGAVSVLSAIIMYASRMRYLWGLPPRLIAEVLHHSWRRYLCDRLPRERAIATYYYFLDIDLETCKRFVQDYDYAQQHGILTPLPLDFYARFLMSTDFFARGADESLPVKYLAFFDPRVSPCFNPLRMHLG